MESMIKVMVFEPLKEPYIEHIKNVEEAYKSIVEGELREQQLDSKTVIVSNADVASVQLQPNRYVGNEVVCGTFFIASNVGEVGYGSLSKEQIQYYYSMYHTPEEISVEDVEEDRLYGLNAVGRNVVYINNLNLKLDEEAIDFTKVAASYKTEGKHEAKELLKKMHEAFCETHGSICVDDLIDSDESMFYLPAVIKARNTGAVCVGLVLVDVESSGEHWDTQFVFSNGFCPNSPENISEETKRERSEIGVYDYWYTPKYYGDIHTDFSAVPEDVQQMLAYAGGSNEQTQGMDMNEISY
mgnify:CR=1 FL=1